MASGPTARSQATKDRILAAARTLFSAQGFEATTIRQIALEAQANLALVIRYFESKENLFAHSVEFDLHLPALDRLDREKLGEHLVAHFLSIWEEDSAGQQLVALLRAASAHAGARARMQDIFETQLLRAISAFEPDEPSARTRATLIASQMLGMALVRYVLLFQMPGLERTALVSILGRTIQRYLTEPV